MTQEIGFVQPYEAGNAINFGDLPIGSVLELLQYHSCDTAARYPVSLKKITFFGRCFFEEFIYSKGLIIWTLLLQ
jgi:hypothetical protein